MARLFVSTPPQCGPHWHWHKRQGVPLGQQEGAAGRRVRCQNLVFRQMGRLFAALFSYCAAHAQPFDFTHFETSLLPQWLRLFRAGATPGAYSFLSANASAGPTLYGSADVAHVLATTNTLGNLSAADRAVWAAQINSFQSPATGFFAVAPWEQAGLQPWHAAAYATAALALLGAQPAAPLAWAVSVAVGGPAAWAAEFQGLLNATTPSCPSIWCTGHKIAAFPAALLMTRGRERDGAFFAWWAGVFLGPAVDPATAMWCSRREWAPPSVACLGGAFHMDFVLTALRQPLFLPRTLLAVVAGMQDSKTGLWGGDASPNYIDLDGVYQVVRPAAQVGAPGGPEWAAARATCVRYLAAAEAALNDPARVLGKVYGANSHILPAAVAGVSECAKFFPELVRTVRPWVQTLDVAPFV